MTNWHYNKSFNNDFHEVFSYDKNPIIDLLAKYYRKDISDEDIICDRLWQNTLCLKHVLERMPGSPGCNKLNADELMSHMMYTVMYEARH